MINEIVTDVAKLSVPCVPVAEGDFIGDITGDLVATAEHYKNKGKYGCSGLAANQIGYDKRIFVVDLGGKFVPMINPVIVKKWGGMVSKPEGCLSFPGQEHKVSRYKRIRLAFNDYRDGARIEFNFKGFAARVIQHELDHLDGKHI